MPLASFEDGQGDGHRVATIVIIANFSSRAFAAGSLVSYMSEILILVSIVEGGGLRLTYAYALRAATSLHGDFSCYNRGLCTLPT